ncbi:MAG: hypothetical protein Q7J98_02540 [Kiritimatiellia bacterium]|nr:hypothetical protein [Kiritimatiellia bacterium]
MIKRFFHGLMVNEVEFLLISGQAAILYGAATFSEDIDLWIKPTAENCHRLRAALGGMRAKYYKLTPPLNVSYLKEGHGFHFLLPGVMDVFVDVMGSPPRVSSFPQAMKRSRRMTTPWGRIPVVSIPDLVELKKTQRLEDYPVISRLVLAHCRNPSTAINVTTTAWAFANMFDFYGLTALAERYQAIIRSSADRRMTALKRMFRPLSGGHLPQRVQDALEADIMRRVQSCRRADQIYWKTIIASLKRLRRQGALMRAGERVT